MGSFPFSIDDEVISFPVIPITQFWKVDSFPYRWLKLANWQPKGVGLLVAGLDCQKKIKLAIFFTSNLF